jgi:hypothetical protein
MCSLGVRPDNRLWHSPRGDFIIGLTLSFSND